MGPISDYKCRVGTDSPLFGVIINGAGSTQSKDINNLPKTENYTFFDGKPQRIDYSVCLKCHELSTDIKVWVDSVDTVRYLLSHTDCPLLEVLLHVENHVQAWEYIPDDYDINTPPPEPLSTFIQAVTALWLTTVVEATTVNRGGIGKVKAVLNGGNILYVKYGTEVNRAIGHRSWLQVELYESLVDNIRIKSMDGPAAYRSIRRLDNTEFSALVQELKNGVWFL